MKIGSTRQHASACLACTHRIHLYFRGPQSARMKVILLGIFRSATTELQQSFVRWGGEVPLIAITRLRPASAVCSPGVSCQLPIKGWVMPCTGVAQFQDLAVQQAGQQLRKPLACFTLHTKLQFCVFTIGVVKNLRPSSHKGNRRVKSNTGVLEQPPPCEGLAAARGCS